MMSYSQQLKTLILASSLLLCHGCGVTHQFTPTAPLPEGKWRYSFVWSYELGGPSIPSIIPDINFYGGLGKGYNIGLGYQVPLFITHVSPIKYFHAKGGDYWAASAHFNEIFCLASSPQVEVCGSYFANRGDFHQGATLGLAYGRWRDNTARMLTDALGGGRIYPVLKYTLATGKWGMSYEHYHGWTAGILQEIRDSVAPNSSTLLSFHPQEIVKSEDRRRHRFSFTCRLRDSTQIDLYSSYFDFEGPALNKFFLASEGCQWVHLTILGPRLQYDRQVIFGVDAFKQQLKHDSLVTIEVFPHRLLGAIEKKTAWRADHSFGIIYSEQFLDRRRNSK